MSPEEKARIKKGAAAARRSVSDWLRLLAEDEIERQNQQANVPAQIRDAEGIWAKSLKIRK